MRTDLEAWLDHAVPDGTPGIFRHTLEGPDDMPAHVKAVVVGESLTLRVAGGDWELGVWQGVYLCEHRDSGGSRSIVATLWGEGPLGGTWAASPALDSTDTRHRRPPSPRSAR